jgi:hypothetical protein
VFIYSDGMGGYVGTCSVNGADYTQNFTSDQVIGIINGDLNIGIGMCGLTASAPIAYINCKEYATPGPNGGFETANDQTQYVATFFTGTDNKLYTQINDINSNGGGQIPDIYYDEHGQKHVRLNNSQTMQLPRGGRDGSSNNSGFLGDLAAPTFLNPLESIYLFLAGKSESGLESQYNSILDKYTDSKETSGVNLIYNASNPGIYNISIYSATNGNKLGEINYQYTVNPPNH